MPVVLRRPTYERLTAEAERAEAAEAERDAWRAQADQAVATVSTVTQAVDTAMCALALVHDMDPVTGVCSCGHPSPCPTGVALTQLWPYWEHMPAKLEGIVDRTPRAAA